MFINRNYFMKLVLLSTITFDIAFAEDDKESCRKSLQIYCNSKRPSNLICAKQAFFFYSINAEPKPLQSTQIFFAEVIFPNTEHRVLISPKDFCNIRGDDEDSCFEALQRYCNSMKPSNLKCAEDAIFFYSVDVHPEPCPSVQIFFAQVILPNIEHTVIISPKDFCKIREIGIGGQLYSAETSSLCGLFGKGKKINPQLSRLSRDQKYLINLQKEIDDPHAVKKCFDDLEDFIDFEEKNPGKTMLEFALLRKANFKLKGGDTYGFKYLEYISKTICRVRKVNEDTNKPENYCNTFDYENGKWAIK